jgi:hypothetical protein
VPGTATRNWWWREARRRHDPPSLWSLLRFLSWSLLWSLRLLSGCRRFLFMSLTRVTAGHSFRAVPVLCDGVSRPVRCLVCSRAERGRRRRRAYPRFTTTCPRTEGVTAHVPHLFAAFDPASAGRRHRGRRGGDHRLRPRSARPGAVQIRRRPSRRGFDSQTHSRREDLPAARRHRPHLARPGRIRTRSTPPRHPPAPPRRRSGCTAAGSPRARARTSCPTPSPGGPARSS